MAQVVRNAPTLGQCYVENCNEKPNHPRKRICDTHEKGYFICKCNTINDISESVYIHEKQLCKDCFTKSLCTCGREKEKGEQKCIDCFVCPGCNIPSPRGRTCGGCKIGKKFHLNRKDLLAKIENLRNCEICDVEIVTNEEIFKLQKGEEIKGRKWIIDHEHSLNQRQQDCKYDYQVRGIIHNNVNKGLGLIGDSPQNVLNALIYLLKYELLKKKNARR